MPSCESLAFLLHISFVYAAVFTVPILHNAEAFSKLSFDSDPGHSRGYEEVLQSRRLQAWGQSPFKGNAKYSDSMDHRIEIWVSLPIRSGLAIT